MFVDLPEAGGSVDKGKSFGNVESVKATSDINSPISGEIVEVNAKLSETPGLVCLLLLFFFSQFHTQFFTFLQFWFMIFAVFQPHFLVSHNGLKPVYYKTDKLGS